MEKEAPKPSQAIQETEASGQQLELLKKVTDAEDDTCRWNWKMKTMRPSLNGVRRKGKLYKGTAAITSWRDGNFLLSEE